MVSELMVVLFVGGDGLWRENSKGPGGGDDGDVGG